MAAKKIANTSTESVPKAPAKKAAKKAATKTAAKKVASVAAPKATKTAVKKAAATPSPKAPKAASKKPSLDEIARGAYLNYRSRIANGLPGDSHNDWLEAERKLGVIH
jgi:hypothetical protein